MSEGSVEIVRKLLSRIAAFPVRTASVYGNGLGAATSKVARQIWRQILPSALHIALLQCSGDEALFYNDLASNDAAFECILGNQDLFSNDI